VSSKRCDRPKEGVSVFSAMLADWAGFNPLASLASRDRHINKTKVQNMSITRLIVVCVGICSLPSEARVVINEILYHPPDAPDAVEFIELYNSGGQEVALKGWEFTKGIQYRFDDSSKIAAHGFLVLASGKEQFQKVYGFEPAGVFQGSLKHKGEKLELSNAAGKKIDSVKFKDNPPWPLSPDGHGASLERISPSADSNDPRNWAPSPFGVDESKPGGTPNKENASFATSLPPIISEVAFNPRVPRPDQPVTVSAKIQKTEELDSVRLFYRIAAAGSEKPEQELVMGPHSGQDFTATIPPQPENSIVRFRIEANNKAGVRRVEPAPFELQPAYSYFVHDKFTVGQIPWGFLVFVDEADYKKEEERPKQQGPGTPGNQDAFMARMLFEINTDLAPLWMDLCLTQHLSYAQISKARDPLAQQIEFREKTLANFRQTPAPSEPLKQAQESKDTFQQNARLALNPVLTDSQRLAFTAWQNSATNTTPPRFTPEKVLQRFCSLEAALLYLSTRSDLSETAFEKMKTIAARALPEREKFIPRVRAAMEGQGDDEDRLIGDVRELHERVGKELADALDGDPARKDFAAWREANNPYQGQPGGRGDSASPAPARGRNAFVYVPVDTGEPELFDFIKANSRNAGYKVHFPKNHTLRGMTGINLIFEYRERFVLAEPLAYEVYRRAGSAAELSDFIRLSVNGRPLAYHLLLEQPNRAFLKRNKLRDDGNLYKILWYERDLIRAHEKKTNLGTGHEDLQKLVDSLEKTKGDEQWAIIKSNFNVDQVATYFAVNMVLSHWDGFFNNYFAYHDLHGTGKWEMYPWDQDKTWGFHDALPEGSIFYDMPLTFGMEGDRPPGYPADKPVPRGFTGNSWWRPGGYFSKPLLANSQFRKIFLARTRDILDNVYTEKIFFPVIDEVRERLREEINIRATVLKQKPEEALAQFNRDLDSLKEHLTKRRAFLLGQDELKALAGR
jgi:hypothetical protein